MTQDKIYYTDYKTAVHWGGAQLILCNNIVDVDLTIYDNMRFNMYDENDNAVEIYQWFLTNLSEWEVEWQEKHFPDLKYTYSDKLDCYVLCVDHFGTPWSGVPTQTTKDLIESNPDIGYKGT